MDSDPNALVDAFLTPELKEKKALMENRMVRSMLIRVIGGIYLPFAGFAGAMIVWLVPGLGGSVPALEFAIVSLWIGMIAATSSLLLQMKAANDAKELQTGMTQNILGDDEDDA